MPWTLTPELQAALDHVEEAKAILHQHLLAMPAGETPRKHRIELNRRLHPIDTLDMATTWIHRLAAEFDDGRCGSTLPNYDPPGSLPLPERSS